MKYILFTLIVLGIYGSVLRVERIKRIWFRTRILPLRIQIKLVLLLLDCSLTFPHDCATH